MTAINTQKDGSGATYWAVGDSHGQQRVVDPWTALLQADEALNDSDKSFTVGAAKEWIIQWIWVELATDAAVGNRQLVIELQDSAADVIFQMRAGIVQAASLTRYYCFAPFGVEITSFRDTDYLYVPLPPNIRLPASYVVRVYDKAAIAAAADDMVVQMMILQRNA